MSFPSTPEKSSEHGLFSSPTRSQSSPIAMQLTPRSKIQALLDLSDDADSDKENRTTAKPLNKHVSPAKKQHPNTLTQQDAGATNATKKRKSPSPTEPEGEEEEGTQGNESLLIAPKSRMAASMKASDVQHEPAAAEGVEKEQELSAYERVKRQLMQEDTGDERPEDGLKDDSKTHSQDSRERVAKSSTRLEDNEAGAETDGPALPESPPVEPVEDSSDDEPRRPQGRRLDNLFNSPSPPRSRQPTPVMSVSADSETPVRPSSNMRLQQLLERKRRELGTEVESEHGRETPSEKPEERQRTSSPPSKAITKKKTKKTQPKQVLELDSDGDSDKETGTKLTEGTRPMRKASKRAQEEMKRETQRLARNMQLTHEARTKTKFSKQDLFAKFNFRQISAKASTVTQPQLQSAPTSSDTERAVNLDTPPSSPPSLGGSASKNEKPSLTQVKENNAMQIYAPLTSENRTQNNPESEDEDDVLPLEAILKQAAQKAPSSHVKEAVIPSAPEDLRVAQTLFSVKKFGKSKSRKRSALQSDDDLEIIASKDAGNFAVFDRMPKQLKRESRSMHALRALANLNVHEKTGKHGKKSMNAGELSAMLHHRAREQARRERDERIQAAVAAGRIVLSAEQQEREQLQTDDMLERARREADALAKKEKAAAKRNGGKEHDENQFSDSDDEDKDWIENDGNKEGADASADEDEDEDEDEGVSGSEEEEDDDAEETNSSKGDKLVMDEADEGGDEESEASEENVPESDVEDGNTATEMPPPPRPLNRKRRIVSDDEDEDDEQPPSTQAARDGAIVTPAKSKAEAFGFSDKDSPQIGLSQVFFGTMADTQTQLPPTAVTPNQNGSSTDVFGFGKGNLNAPGLSQVFQATMGDSPMRMTPGSIYSAKTTQAPDFSPVFRRQDRSQSYVVGDSQNNQTQLESVQNSPLVVSSPQVGFAASQTSDVPEPTQDQGFSVSNSQAQLPASYSTVATEPLTIAGSVEQPKQARKGRFQRGIRGSDRSQAESEDDDDDENEVVQSNTTLVKDPSLSSNAFDVMRKSSKAVQKRDDYNRKKSMAKEMVAEQAEESEDEYAGLGGASDDESGDEVDEETKKLIDDDGNEKVNERQLAALHAERQMADDEKHMQRLFTDVVGGGLRRKRGGDMDLFEFDDEDEAAERRRVAKQRHEAKMRKALLADEKIGKIAENPKQAAFLQAIADRDEEDDVAFLDLPEEISQSQTTNSQPATQVQDTQLEENLVSSEGEDEDAGEAVKSHDAIDFAAGNKENKQPNNPRRNARVTKPTSLVDIRNTLSELVGLPNSIAETQYEEVDESELSFNDEEVFTSFDSRTHAGSRRTETSIAQRDIIDRMAVKRANSNNTRDNSQDRLAFNTSFKASSTSFKAPSLLRRATTNSSFTSESSYTDRASGGSSAAGKGKEAVKMGGSKKSSVNYYVREQEKKARLDEIERKRNDERVRVGKKRGNGQALGALAGGGKFA